MNKELLLALEMLERKNISKDVLLEAVKIPC